MKYRDIIGYSDKQPRKRVVKEQSKPSVTEALKKEFGDTINEGPAMEYVNDVKQIEKTEKLKAKAVKNLAKVLDKKGFKKEAKNLNYVYSIYEDKFSSYIQELMNKLQ
jgi:spore germination protein YaaH